ncbi:MAG: DNA-directed RNA polymerase subunit delta, partial [Bacilli bacterium]|nr:DNA-directed RNA polymerase subunit delta [Bacilli bacterium]
MKLDKMKKEDIEVLSNKELTTLILKEEKKPQTTADLFKRIIGLLELPDSTFENKIAEFYTQLATDKEFTFLDNGKWDLSINHKQG